MTPQSQRKRWTDAERTILAKHYPHSLQDEMAALLPGRSLKSIYMQAILSGLKKTKATLKRAGQLRPMTDAVKANQFKPGIVPHNTGRPMSEWMGEAERKRCERSQFRAGQRPATAHPVGHVYQRQHRRDKHPYLYISTEKGMPKLYQRHVWEEANGPIPRGHVIAFIDRNTLNCELSNLACISRADNMARNSIHRYPADLKQVIKLTGKLKKKIHEKQN